MNVESRLFDCDLATAVLYISIEEQLIYISCFYEGSAWHCGQSSGWDEATDGVKLLMLVSAEEQLM
jgi:hypothetical protein